LLASAGIAAGRALPTWSHDKVYEGATGFGIGRVFATGKFNQMNLGVRKLLAHAKAAG
jgi:hypothetical protein